MESACFHILVALSVILSLNIFFCHSDSFPDHRFHWTIFITVSTVQTMLLPDDKRCSLLNTFLWTMFHTFPASDTGFCYVISFFSYPNISKDICLSKNRIHSKVEIFHFRLINTENNTDFSCIPGYTFARYGCSSKMISIHFFCSFSATA